MPTLTSVITTLNVMGKERYFVIDYATLDIAQELGQTIMNILFSTRLVWISGLIGLLLFTNPLVARADTRANTAPSSTPTLADIAFAKGDYERVIAQADLMQDAHTLALAARTLNTQAYLNENDRAARKLAKRARGFAERAIEKDDTLVEAYLQAALSDAMRGDRISPVRAVIEGLAGRSRKLLDRALALDPDNFWALSTSGAWHLEVARAGGASVFGADKNTGYEQMIRARALAPDNIAVAYEAALRLIAADEQAWRTVAMEALEVAASTGTIVAHHENALRTRANELAQALNQGERATRAFIKKYG